MAVEGNEDDFANRRELDEYARSGVLVDSLAAMADLARQLLGCAAVVIGLAGRAGSGSAAVVSGTGLPAAAHAAPESLIDPVGASDLGLGFYAGVALRGSDGRELGTLVALDPAPRDLRDTELAALRLAAAVVSELIELRRAAGLALPGAGRAVR